MDFGLRRAKVLVQLTVQLFPRYPNYVILIHQRYRRTDRRTDRRHAISIPCYARAVKIDATKCHIVRINSPNSISAGADPFGRANYSAPPNPLTAFKGYLMGEEGKVKGREGKRREGKESWRGDRRRWNGREERASHTAAALCLAKPRAVVI